MDKQFAENFFNELCMDFYNPETGSVNKLDKFYSKDLLVEIDAYKLNYGRFKNRILNVHGVYDSCKFNIKNIIVFGNSFIIDFSCAFSPKDTERDGLVKSMVVHFTLRQNKIVHEKVLSEESFYFKVEEKLSVVS